MSKLLAQLILDRYAHSIVIPWSKIGFDKRKNTWFVSAKWKQEAHKYQYEGYSSNIVLWIPPINSLAIEFEGTREQNELWIHQTEARCVELGFDYCICDHEGKSPYLWIFNIQGLETHEEKKALTKLLIPEGSNIDWTNLGQTLVPVIQHPHWKHNNIHKICAGKNPLLHKNQLPKDLKDLIVQKTQLPRQPTIPCDDSSVEFILRTDKFVRRLIDGDISGYPSPSEARMALLFALVGYGLGDSEIHQVMSMSRGLHYHEKSHLHGLELNKARALVLKRRG